VKQSLPDEVLTQMAASDRVNTRTQGVIAVWLRQQRKMPDIDEITAAKDLIHAMNAAGLATSIKSQLDEFIDNLKAKSASRWER
jgi:hypothetical protein